MALHAKTQLRNQAVTQTTGLTTTGANVFNERVYPSGSDKIPGLNWTTGDEEKELDRDTIGRREMWRVSLICEARGKPADGDADLDEYMDTIQAEVQEAIMSDDPPTLGNRAWSIELQRVRKRSTGTLERPTGIVEMEFMVEYFIMAGDPTTLIYYA